MKQNAWAELVQISKQLQEYYYKQDSPWTNSPFAWIICLPSRKLGAFAENLLSKWLELRGIHVDKPRDSEADRILQLPGTSVSKRVEIKFSSLWANNTYRFQQIRDQKYDILLCFGLSPYAAHLWACPKDDIMQWWHKGVIKSQHRGQRGRDTAWIHVDPKRVPRWMAKYGGSLDEGLRSLKRLLSS